MVLTGAALIPHGTMILDPAMEGLPDGAAYLHERTMEMAKEISALNVSLLILVTPHGFSLEEDIGVYLNEQAKGTAEWKSTWKEFEVDTKMSHKDARQLLDAWKAAGIKSQGMNAFTGETFPLAWGEVVPLWFLQQGGFKGKIIVTSVPMTRMRDLSATGPLDQLYDAGEKLAEFCGDDGMWKDERVFIAVSGDLAHAHPTDFPNPLFVAEPDWDLETNSADATALDVAFEEWALDRVRGRSLAVRCLKLHRTGLSCGLKGLLLLEGALHREDKLERPYAGKLFARRTPTYFTMMSCLFAR